MSTGSLTQLQLRVKAAVDNWVTPVSGQNLLHQWRGTGDGVNPNEPCLALVQYCRQVKCAAGDAFLNEHLEQLAKLTGHDHLQSAKRFVPFSQISGDGDQQQLAHLVQGIAACVRAAIEARAGNEPAAIQRLSESAQHYSAAWPLTNIVVEPPKSAGPNLTNSRESQQLLQRTVLSLSEQHQSLSVSTWLILERLLAVLFREEAARVDFANEVKVLFFLAGNTDAESKGLVRSFDIRRRPHDHTGLLVDPLAFGATVLDYDLIRSLRSAFRVARQSVMNRPGSLDSAFALELTGVVPSFVAQLSGESAGGLLGVGLYATAAREPLDPSRTATLALRVHARSVDDDATSLNVEHLKLKAVDGIEQKLAAAAFRESGLEAVALTRNNHQTWVKRHGETVSTRTEPIATFERLYQFLRGERLLEVEVKQHARQIAAEWDQIVTAGHVPIDGRSNQELDHLRSLNETHRFDCYVSPRYKIQPPRPVCGANIKAEMNERQQSQPVVVPGDDDEALLQLLAMTAGQTLWESAPEWLRQLHAQGPRWLVVYDSAGSGKTVFTYRLKHVAASPQARALFGHRSPFVVRWEGAWPRDGHGHLLSLTAALEQQFARDRGWGHDAPLPGHQELVARCVQYALREERVIIILDGFDQFSPDDEAHIKKHLSRNSHSRAEAAVAARCRWIVAGRVHSIEQESGDVFDDRRFRRIQIDPLEPIQQQRYFDRRHRRGSKVPIGRTWLECLGIDLVSDSNEQISEKRLPFADLLGLPMTLWLIGELIDATPADQSLPRFESLSDLAYQVAAKLLDEARKKNSQRIKGELHRQQIRVPVFTGDFQQQEDEERELLQRALTLIAFELMLAQNWNGRVSGADLSEAEDRWRQRFVREQNLAFMAARKQGNPDAELEAGEQLDAARLRWKYALAVLKTIELKHRSVTEVFNPAGGLAFRSRKMVEFHAAWYLARFATDADRYGATPSDLSAWSFSYDETPWTECWKLAIEMPPAGRDLPVWAASLAVPFRPVGGEPHGDAPEHRLRPTELIFRAWQALTRAGAPQLRSVLAEYRRPFDEILRTADIAEAKLAAQLIPLDVLKERVTDHRRFKQICPPADEPAYVRCPPVGNELTFWMGSADDAPGARDHEKPRHPFTIPAFLMATCTVTRAQYRLFDPALERRYSNDFTRIAPDDDCPVILANWFDGFALALWLGDGASLPTETQWEGAARAGRDGPDDIIGVPPFHAGFTNAQVNYGGNYPLPGQPESGYLKRTLPVRWNGRQKQAATASTLQALPAYQPNDWEIWQAHGNVWEWCMSAWDAELYRRRESGATGSELDDIVSNAVGIRRVLRGGSGSGGAEVVRSAFRDRGAPDERSGFIGIRLSWRWRVESSF